jgi:thiol:disulfide interchange protein DsbA
MRRSFFALLGALSFYAADAGSQPLAGIDYRLLPDRPEGQAGQPVEVLYFFWYRCPHCYALEPLLEPWLAKLPHGAKFTRVPAVLGRKWLLDARLYYSLEALGELERLHRPLLDAIHTEGGVRLEGKAYTAWVADWMQKHGVDRAAYAAAFDSPAVDEKVKRATELARSNQLEATPTMVVGRRYVVDPPPEERRRLLGVTGYLVQQTLSENLARR